MINACILTLAAALAALPLSAEIRTETRNGAHVLVVDAPEGSSAARKANFHLKTIDVKPFAGKHFGASIRMRCADVGTPSFRFGGVKFQLKITGKDGKAHYYQPAEIPVGTKEFVRVELDEVLPSDAVEAVFRIGLQCCPGRAEFELDSLEYGAFRYPADPEAKPLTEQQKRELEWIRTRLRKKLAPPFRNPETARKDCLNRISRQKPDGSFPDVNYDSRDRGSWETLKHFGHLNLLARYRTLHGTLPGLDDALRKGVELWVRKRPVNSNWWNNEMAVPERMAQVLLLSGEAIFPFASPLRKQALEVCLQAMQRPRYTGNNRVFIASNIFYRGLLARNIEVMRDAAAVLTEEIRPAPLDVSCDKDVFGGIRADGSYQLHGPQVQFGNYGGEFLCRIAFWGNIWRETEFALKPEQLETISHLAFDGFARVLHHGRMDLLAIGRQLRENAALIRGRNYCIRNFRIFAELDPARADEYRRAEQEKFSGTRWFWNSDYLTCRRDSFFASFRANSVRTRPLEDDINGDNSLGRYFSDGACLIYQTGDEYDGVTLCWNWTRLPGTTLPATPVLDEKTCAERGIKISGGLPAFTSFGLPARRLGTTAFVGGVSDGNLAAAVYSQDIDGVKAKKAVFFDTDAVIELGTEIKSVSPYEVATTVNACRARGSVRTAENLVWHDDIAYLGENLHARQTRFSGDTRTMVRAAKPQKVEMELFELTVPHGKGIKNGEYAVMIVPGADFESAKKLRNDRILANSGDIQAVRFADGTIGAVFHKPGRLGGFVTDSPGVFLIRKDAVYAADPTQRLKQMTLNGKTVNLPQGTGTLAGSTERVEMH